MTTPVTELRGITDAIATALKGEGASDNHKLLEKAKTPAGRKELAAACNCTARDILELANRADLARINGVGGAYSDLLEKAGVDTVKELRNRRPDNLHAKITEINADHAIAKQPPSEEMVAGWVAQAKELPPMIEY